MKKVIFVILTVLLLVPVLALAEEKDKIAVATDEKAANSSVSNRIGRSPFYLLFDAQGRFVEAIENPFRNDGRRPQGSMVDSLSFDEKGTLTGGVTTPSKDERDKTWNAIFSFLAQKRIKVIVAEEFGDEIIRGFKAQGISCVAFKGKAEEAVKRILQPN